MVSDVKSDVLGVIPRVLILVLMEYGLWLAHKGVQKFYKVLILVLMEYGLWQARAVEYQRILVLILVLMEYGLWPETGGLQD